MRNQHKELSKQFSLWKLEKIQPSKTQHKKAYLQHSPSSDKENFQNGCVKVQGFTKVFGPKSKTVQQSQRLICLQTNQNTCRTILLQQIKCSDAFKRKKTIYKNNNVKITFRICD